jgi:hypothetical protein
VGVGARQLAEHHRVEAVGLAGGGAEAPAGGGELVGVHGHHAQAGGEQTTHQEAIGALDRDQPDAVVDQQPDQGTHPLLGMSEATAPRHRFHLVGDVHVVVLGGPVDRAGCSHRSSSSVEVALKGADREVPWRCS